MLQGCARRSMIAHCQVRYKKIIADSGILALDAVFSTAFRASVCSQQRKAVVLPLLFQAILSAEPLTFVHGKQKYNPPILAGTKNIGRVIDIEHSVKAQVSEGYAHWAKLHNLQEQSKTFNYLTENGLLDSCKVDQDLAELSAALQQSKAELKATEKRLKDVNHQLRLLGQYFKTKAVYREYIKGGRRKDFAAAHRSELELYDAVVKELRELFGDQKLPSVQSLKQEKAQLAARKEAQYESYSALRTQWMELSKLVRNRDSIAGQAMQSERNSKKRTI